jgi:hypothetical protein
MESITVDGNTLQRNQAMHEPVSVNSAADPNVAVLFEDGTATFDAVGSPPQA